MAFREGTPGLPRTLARGLSVWPHVTGQERGLYAGTSVCSGNSRGSREGGRPKACFSWGWTNARPAPCLAPRLPGPRAQARAPRRLPRRASGTRGATTRSPGPPCGHRVTSSVPCHRSGLNRLRHRVWTQDASRSLPARSAPRPGHCCLYWGPQRWSLVTPLTQTLSAALTAAGGSTCRPTVSLWPPNEHVT